MTTLMHKNNYRANVRKQNLSDTKSIYSQLQLHVDWLQHRLTPFDIMK